ncbi:VOC family protein [Gammaproteobacteria bacterium]|nr:VOC family protein [Gammaproteobacteria bacterium]MDA9048368.1 VOC family protein [Gammaproteobacteria bacterium]MDA9365098.1 VOC family protein [Gammaproteobacteria bacterium]MDC1525205.1 VOC family protein [Gammaproteobacteria bacterium]|tara:strand:+ start:2810 stop:3223 length:414 start_codon:yes stop_codon:yes gene_type:complete
MPHPFHLAIPVTNLADATIFYETILGCSRGREDEHWIDFNLYGHQLVCHLSPDKAPTINNSVDGDSVPVPHFGVILNFKEFDGLAMRLKNLNQPFVLEPRTRFAGEPGEQRTMFLLDPSGNAIEFKAFANLDNLFKS